MYQPHQRQVTAQIYSTAGWLEGTFHLPKMSKLLEGLNKEPEFYRLTDVNFLARKGLQLEFFALQRRSTVLIVPPDGESDLRLQKEETRPIRVYCLFEGGYVEGRMRLRKGVRVSDYLPKQDGFVLLENCKLRLGDITTDFFVEEEHDAVLINAGRVVGFSEESPV
jgi:hypothetical protein